MNKIFITLLLAGILFVGSLALAEEATNRTTPTVLPKVSPIPSVNVKAQGEREKIKNEVEATRSRLKKEAEEQRERLKDEAEAKRERIKKEMELARENAKKRKEEFKETVKTKQEELKVKIETKREKLKVRLERVKDERKKEVVERIDQQIDALNEKMIKHFSSVLEKLEDILVRISERADKASTERGVDVSLVRSAIDKANTAIASARLAVENQSEKTYTIKITTESALKVDVGKTRQMLGADLAKVRDAVKTAQSAVKDSAVALAQLVVRQKPSPLPLVSPESSPTLNE